MSQINMNSAISVNLESKREFAKRLTMWIVVVASVVVWQLYIPKLKMDTGVGRVTWSLNGIFRGLFVISPRVGFICSAGGQLNVPRLVWANPLFLLSPTIYAFLGVIFHKIAKKAGKGAGKEIFIIMLFGIVQGIFVTFNSAITNSLSGVGLMAFRKTLSQLTFGIVAIRALCNGLLYCITYPLIMLVRKNYGNKDPFRIPIYIKVRGK